MREIIEIKLFRDACHEFGWGISCQLFDLLTDQFPEGRKRDDFFRIDLEVGSQKCHDFFSFLTQHDGPSLNTSAFPVLDYRGSGLFSAGGTREFSACELDSANYFVLFCRDIFSNSNDYLETGEPRVWIGDMKKSGVGSGNQIEIFLENSTKQILESCDLSGLSFRHVVVESKKRSSNIPIVWQIWPEITLPPMKSPKCDLDGVSLDLDFDVTNGFQINDRRIFSPKE